MKIALIIILVIVLAIVLLTMFRRYTTKNMYNSILRNYRREVEVLLNSQEIPDFNHIDRELRNKILSFPAKDWQDWGELLKSARRIAYSHPEVFLDYLGEYFPEVKSRKCCRYEKFLFNSAQSKCESLIEAMTLEELRLINSETEENWLYRESMQRKLSELRQEFPEGYSLFCNIHNNDKISPSDIFKRKREIIELQKQSDIAKSYEGWEERQKQFSETFYNSCKTTIPNNGRFIYNIPFNKPLPDGSYSRSSFILWQTFYKAFSFANVEFSSFNNNILEWIPKFKTSDAYYQTSEYEGIYELIKYLKDSLCEAPLIILMNQTSLNWMQDAYDYHYEFIKEKFLSNGFQIVEYTNLHKINSSNISFKFILVIDFITTNKDLFDNSRLIIEYFTNETPCIGYYSILKEYSEEEVKKFYPVKTAQIEEDNAEIGQSKHGQLSDKKNNNEEDIIGFIESEFKRVRKHPYFSYLAITNSLIGEAAGADKIKAQWLDNPEKFNISIKTKENNGILEVDYTLDEGKTLYNFKCTDLRKSSFNDTVKFTYLLFKKMGVLQSFLEHGQNAIDFMNDHGYLRNR